MLFHWRNLFEKITQDMHVLYELFGQEMFLKNSPWLFTTGNMRKRRQFLSVLQFTEIACQKCFAGALFTMI